jgi:hypothetical protein
VTRLVLVGLGLALVAGIGWHLLQEGVNAFAADQRERSALIRSEGSWTPPANDPRIHYAPPVVVDLDHQGVRR